LIQRKFMRHILGSDATPLPRLVIVDFIQSGKLCFSTIYRCFKQRISCLL